MQNRSRFRTLLAAACSVTALSVFASAGMAQASDNCADAPNLTADGAYPFDLAGATNDFAGTCGATGTAEDVWYKYTAAAAGHLIVNTCGGTTMDSTLSLLDGCGGTVLACNDDFCGLQSQVEADLTAGQVVYIRIARFAGGTGSGNINVTLAGPLAPCTENPPGSISEDEACGDDGNGGCNNANQSFFELPAVPFDVTVFGNAWANGNTRDTDWYRFNTVGGAGAVHVTATVHGDLPLNLFLVNVANCNALSIPAFAFAPNRCTDTASYDITVPDGIWAVFVAPNTFNGQPCDQVAGNNYVLTVTTEAIVLPPGDGCGTAFPAVVGSNAYDTNGFTADGDNVCFAGDQSPSEWFTYTAGQNGVTSVDTCGETNDTVIAVFGDCGTPVIRCDDDGCGVFAGGSNASFATVLGNTYHIRISSFNNGEAISGNFVITELPPPANDNCADAEVISEGDTAFDLTAATTEGPEASCVRALYGRGDINDVWYRFTAPRAGILRATTCGSNFKIVTIWDSCGGTELACGGYTGPLSDCPNNFTGNGRLAVTANQTVLIRVSAADFFGLGVGAGNLNVTIQDPLTPCVVIPPGAVSEDEACGDDANGGCNNPDQPFFELPAGAITIAGSMWADHAFRDTDWYRVQVPSAGTRITASLQADLPAFMFLFRAPSGDCNGGLAQIAFATALTRCEDTASINATVGAGTYIAVVLPSSFADFPCGTVNNYVFSFESVTTGACCASTGCSLLSEAECAAAGGTYRGDGTDCGNYVSATSTSAYEDISATGTAGPDGDDVNTVVDVGFDFTFYGNTFSQVSICTNGFLQFGDNLLAQTVVNVPLPSNGFLVPVNAVCGLWDDLITAGGGADLGGSGNIVYQTVGSAPNRRFIAQWINVGQFNQPPFQNAEGGPVNFEIVLFEGTNNIEFRYGSITPDPTGGTPQADYTVGVQNSDGTIGLNVDTTTLGAGNTALAITLTNPCANTCRADYNGDGLLNADDLGDFFTDFFDTPPAPRSDYNGDHVFNADDIGDFITDYFNGC